VSALSDFGFLVLVVVVVVERLSLFLLLLVGAEVVFVVVVLLVFVVVVPSSRLLLASAGAEKRRVWLFRRNLGNLHVRAATSSCESEDRVRDIIAGWWWRCLVVATVR